MNLKTDDGGESVDFLHAEPTVDFMAKVELFGLIAFPVVAIVAAVIALWRYFGN